MELLSHDLVTLTTAELLRGKGMTEAVGGSGIVHAVLLPCMHRITLLYSESVALNVSIQRGCLHEYWLYTTKKWSITCLLV